MDETEPGDRVSAAMATTARERFLPESARFLAALDQPVRIAAGQTCSQPRTVAAMLRLLDVRPGQRVLDVGSGSGWTTALLADLVGPDGEVLGVELEPVLVSFGTENLAKVGRPWARIEQADEDVLGRPAGAPYDRVLVSAMAAALPDALVAQLADDGVLVAPVDGRMLRVTRTPQGPRVSKHGHYSFVPLR